MPAPVMDLADLDGGQGFIIQGAAAGDHAGYSVSSAGDINGDGFDDLIVGALASDDGGPNAGKVYVIFGKSGGFSNIDLNSLTAAQGFAIQGDATDDHAGNSISSAGDINGDGFDDLIVGARYGDNAGGMDAGEAYVIFGKSSGFTDIDLTSFTSAYGFIIQGDAPFDQAGWSVRTAGDVNGDGFDDLIVGARLGDDGGTFAGEAYVIFGKSSGFTNIDLGSLTAADGFVIQGDAAGDYAGWSASSAGDVNGDGFDDLVVGAPHGDNGGANAGEAYVIFGQSGGLTNIDLTSLTAAQGYVIQGDAAGDRAGISVAFAGDVNGDGFDDLIVGAQNGDNGGVDAGAAYVIFGKSGGFTNIDLTSLTESQGFIIQGDAAGDWAGFSVSSAGDVNGDGLDDLIVGARFGDDGGTDAGEAYVIFGKSGGLANIDLTSLTAAQGFVIQGDAAGDQAGFSVASAGDINGDGFDDLIVGSPFGDDGGTNAGEAYVIFGKANFGDNSAPVAVDDSFTAAKNSATTLTAAQILGNDVDADGNSTLSISAVSNATGGTALLNPDGSVTFTPATDFVGAASFDYIVTDGSLTDVGHVALTVFAPAPVIDLTTFNSSQGFIIQGDTSLDVAGDSVSSAGDINGDGFDDVIVGAPGLNIAGTDAGEAYVIFGKSGGFTDIDLTSLTAAQGFIIQGNSAFDRLGCSVSSAGDINGDGFDDLIVGAPLADNGGTNAGEAYVIFGKSGGFTDIDVTSLTAAQGFIIQGDDEGDGAGYSVASAGDVNGDGFDDLIVGASRGDDGGLYAGEAYVIFGKSGGFTDIDLTSLTAAEGFILRGGPAFELAGSSVSSAGDIDGDGFDDLIIGAPGGGNGAGAAYIIYGRSSGFTNIDLGSLTSAQGFTILGDMGGDFVGCSVSSAGDVNGDGFDDLIVGACYADKGGTDSGQAYVIFGKSSGFADIDLGSLTSSQGFMIQGDSAFDRAGFSVSSAGDVNGDGFDDVIVGARHNDDGFDAEGSAGAAYVIFGKSGGFTDIDLTALTASQGFIILGDSGNDQAGNSVSSAGDVNGDGFDDLIVGARYGDNGGNAAGEAYVIFGKANFGVDGETDVDDFDVGPVSDSDAAANTVSENAPSGTPVGITATASDADATNNAISYSLDDDAGGRFAIDSASGAVNVADGSLLDYETAASHQVTVKASSADGSSSVATFTIDLTDVAEDDIATGTGGDDVMDGGPGNDTLDGGAGADTVRGGVGDDTLDGGKGNDRMVGGSGDDILTGGQGKDVFEFGPGSGQDHVTDFGKKELIAITGVAGVDDFSDLTIVDVAGSAVVSWGTGDSITLDGYRASKLSAADFSFAPPAFSAASFSGDIHGGAMHTPPEAWMP